MNMQDEIIKNLNSNQLNIKATKGNNKMKINYELATIVIFSIVLIVSMSV